MLKLLLITFFSLNTYAYIVYRPDYIRELNDIPPTRNTAHTKLYAKWRLEINPFVRFPYSSIFDKTTDNNQENIYAETYNTEDYGLRVTPGAKKNLLQHLIVSGDSNVFGVGCADNQTLPFYLSKIFTDHSVYNFGLGGTAAHSSLRFLDIFSLKEMFPLNYKKGIFIFDFHDFHIQRMIGSKAYQEWGATTPKYSLNSDNIPVYDGPWTLSWQKKFYSFLDIFPQSKKLFPDLPRISDRHIDLSARILLALKNKYLEQTSKDNRFIVFINPEGKRIKYPGIMIKNDSEEKININEEMEKKLKELNVEVITFKDEEILDLPKYRLDGHFKPEGQRNYAQMIADKIRAKN